MGLRREAVIVCGVGVGRGRLADTLLRRCACLVRQAARLGGIENPSMSGSAALHIASSVGNSIVIREPTSCHCMPRAPVVCQLPLLSTPPVYHSSLYEVVTPM